jgi:glutathione S-transferase
MHKLLIGDRNYSSWSLRAWLLMRQCGIAFEERLLLLDTPEFEAGLAGFAPARTVPTLVTPEGLVVWDTLAITEYLAERFPDAGIWPDDAALRARARSLCAEMHSSFHAMRERMPMNIAASLPGKGRDAEVEADIARVFMLLTQARSGAHPDGPFLFGRFGAADAFYAPVLMRMRTYGVELPVDLVHWGEAMLALAPMRAWIDAARDEGRFLAREEPYRAPPPGAT